METIKFLGLLAVTWLFVTGAGSIQFLKSILKLDNNAKIKNVWLSLIRELINCAMCSGFWIGLSFYLFYNYEHFFLLACLCSVSSEIFTRIMNLILNKWLNQI